MDVTRERISRILELREIHLSIQTGFSLVNTVVVCAILESISGLEPSSIITEPRYLTRGPCWRGVNKDPSSRTTFIFRPLFLEHFLSYFHVTYPSLKTTFIFRPFFPGHFLSYFHVTYPSVKDHYFPSYFHVAYPSPKIIFKTTFPGTFPLTYPSSRTTFQSTFTGTFPFIFSCGLPLAEDRI